MANAIYINHETAEVYKDKKEAMEVYRKGTQIDLYMWSKVLGEYTWCGSWEV